MLKIETWNLQEHMEQFHVQWSRLNQRWKLYYFGADGVCRVVRMWE